MPGHDDGFLEFAGSRRRPAELRPVRGVQLRQGAAQPGRAGRPRLPGRGDGRSAGAQHRGRGIMTRRSPQDDVERALQAARGDCVVIAEESSSANLRWAGNTLTTNGIQRSRWLTVIAVSPAPRGPAVGVVSKVCVRPDQIPDLVAEAQRTAASGSPAPDAQPLGEPAGPGPGPGWDAPARES